MAFIFRVRAAAEIALHVRENGRGPGRKSSADRDNIADRHNTADIRLIYRTTTGTGDRVFRRFSHGTEPLCASNALRDNGNNLLLRRV